MMLRLFGLLLLFSPSLELPSDNTPSLKLSSDIMGGADIVFVDGFLLSFDCILMFVVGPTVGNREYCGLLSFLSKRPLSATETAKKDFFLSRNRTWSKNPLEEDPNR